MCTGDVEYPSTMAKVAISVTNRPNGWEDLCNSTTKPLEATIKTEVEGIAFYDRLMVHLICTAWLAVLAPWLQQHWPSMIALDASSKPSGAA